MGARNASIFLIYVKLTVFDVIIQTEAPTANAKLICSISIESYFSFAGSPFAVSKCMNHPDLRKTKRFRSYNTSWSSYSERKTQMFDLDRKRHFVRWGLVWGLEMHESSLFT